jgi:biotin carboxyl carrier protein
MRYIVTINNKSYEVEVEKGQATVLKVEDSAAQAAQAAAQAAAAVQASPAPAAQPASPAPAAAPAAVSEKGQAVPAPMPGTILSVKVKSGQAVKKGEILFILEAMKMENEIFAPVDGVVAQVAASAGTSVNTGDVLAIIQ